MSSPLDSRKVGYPQTWNTERLIMRPNTEEDIDSWTNFMNDDQCLTYFPAYQNGDPRANANTWIEGQIKRYTNGEFGTMSIINKIDNSYVGQAGLLNQKIEGENELEIAYSLLSSQWGNGYATETSRFLKQWAFAHSSVDSLISLVHAENQASKKVAIRNGMTLDKTLSYKGLPVEVFRIERER